MVKNKIDLTGELVQIFCASVYRFFGVTITKRQEKIAHEVIYRVLLRKRHTIVISVCRQIGKTEVICYLLWFLTYIFPAVVKHKFRACVTAPERGTGTEVYDRTKSLFDSCETRFPDDFSFKKKTLDEILLPDDSKIEIFGLFKGFATRETKKSTKEGRTYEVVVRDEMHLGDDEIFTDELEPALSTTGGVDIYIGNGGYRLCKAKNLCERGVKDSELTVIDDTSVFLWTYDLMRDEMLAEYDRTGNEMFQRWVMSQDKYIDDNGVHDDLVRKNLFCEWMVTVGTFVDWKIFQYHKQEPGDTFTEHKADCGIDWAKESDETVLTITDYNRNIRDWATFHGEYTDQIDEIKIWLPQAARRNDVNIRNIICDSTGAGDPVTAMLRRKIRGPRVHGVVFTPKNKDKLAKKAIKAFTNDSPYCHSYPANHKYTKKYEMQMRQLERERRTNTGLLNYHHPNVAGAKDDFPDSHFLSLWFIEKVDQVRTHATNTIAP